MKLGKYPVRAWVNQPSTFQQYHDLHGKKVLAVLAREGTARIYFLEGNTIDQEIDPIALSEGWPEAVKPRT
jgi:hypothetical protein